MKIAFCVFAILCLINVNMVSSLQSPKSCTEMGIVAMQGFQNSLYLGPWFMHQLYDYAGGDWFLNQPYFPGSAKFNCLVIARTPRQDGNMDVVEVITDPNISSKFIARGQAIFNHPGEGRYIYTSTDIPKYNGSEFIIIKTDYHTYTIEYACTDLSGGGSDVQLYIFSRAPIVPFLSQAAIDKVIKDNNFNSSAIRKMNIFSCPKELLQSNGSGGLLGAILKLVTDLLGGVLRILG